MREYGKIHSSFWTSQDIREAGEDGRTLAAYLLTSPHSNMLGCFRVPLAYVSDDLKWPLERVLEGFEKLSKRVWLTFDKGSEWVVIHKFLKWNQPENPNVVRAAEKLFAQIPSSSNVKPILAWAIAEFESRFSVDKLVEFKPFANPFDTSPKAYRKPEPEPLPEPEPEPEPEEEPYQPQAESLGQTPPPDDPPNGSSSISRAVEIAVYLRQRGIVGANSVNPNISAWSDDARVTNEILDAAISKAHSSLEQGKAPGVNYLATIIPDLLAPKPARPAVKADDWHRSEAGIKRKAKELGITSRSGESWDQLKGRVWDEIRSRERQGAAA
jgi:hypothetical protein